MAGVDGEAEEVGEHLRLRKFPVLRIDPGGDDHCREQILLILAIHDRESRAKSGGFRVTAENAVSDRVKRAAPQAGDVVWNEAGDAVEHFARGLVGEREQQDVLRFDAVFEQIGDAINERAGLAAARSGDHERGSRRGGDGLELLPV